MNLRRLKHELHIAWRRYQLSQLKFRSGLGDSGWFLHGLVRSMKPEACVEIGSAHGYSTCLISLALKLNLKGRLWAVDPHIPNSWSDTDPENTFENLKANLARLDLSARVEIVRKTSSQATEDLPSKIDFAFIDGDHSYEGVKTDWEIISSRMAPFGIIVFHDTMWDRNSDSPYYQKYRDKNMRVPVLMEELRLQGYPIVTINSDWGLSLLQLPRGGESFTTPSSPT